MDLRNEFKRATGLSADKWIKDLKDQLDDKLQAVKSDLDSILSRELSKQLESDLEMLWADIDAIDIELSLEDINYVNWLENERSKTNTR